MVALMTARFIVADVMEGLASLETGSVDVVITSPPFLALRSYLPAEHELKGKEIGSEATPAEFIDTMLRVTAEWRRVLAPHGSICVELGDTYAGSGGAGGDYDENGLRDGQPRFRAQRVTPDLRREGDAAAWAVNDGVVPVSGGAGWPLAKSRTLIPSLYQIALAYGFNPLTGVESPAGQWRIRNVVTWARPNPPVGALGDKWRPATSDLVIACTSGKRYWDDLATRKASVAPDQVERPRHDRSTDGREDLWDQGNGRFGIHSSGAPLLDYWVIPPGGYTGAHYAVFPEELVIPCVQAMCPQRVCVTCGEPSRRIVEDVPKDASHGNGKHTPTPGQPTRQTIRTTSEALTVGFSDCGHDNWRPGLVLDPFAGSGTTLVVATGHGHDAIGIDLDSRNAELARNRVGPFLFEMVDA